MASQRRSKNVLDSSSPGNNPNARAVHRRTHRFRARPLQAFRQQHQRVPCRASAGTHKADVTEGSGGIWERLHYDWSDPHNVVLTTTDSNVWGGASGHTYNFTSHPDGTTDIDVDIVREGKNLKGRLLGLVLRTIGKGVLERAFV